MTRSTPSHPEDPDDELEPAGFGAKLLLTAAPFVLAALVYLVLRWLT